MARATRVRRGGRALSRADIDAFPGCRLAAMGLTTLDVEVGNPATPEVTRAIKFLVDSGAVLSVVPRKILEELGVRPLGRQKFRLANGDHISREKGIAFFRYGDRVGGADVIFGEENDSNL